jgi:hypothetical protein
MAIDDDELAYNVYLRVYNLRISRHKETADLQMKFGNDCGSS